MTPQAVLRVLAAGFGMVMVLGIWLALEQAAAVRESAAGLVREQLLTARLLNDVQVEENALKEVLHRVARAPSNLDRRELLADLARADEVLERLAQETRHAPEAAVWGELRNSAARFTEEVRRVLRGPLKDSREELVQLFGLHDNVVQLSRTLLDATNGRLSVADDLIEKQSRDLAG
jgi:hypothetical protein